MLNFYNCHFPWVFYFSVLYFGLIHIFNYSLLTPLEILASPLITLPQISGVLTLGFIRMKHGLKWNSYYHIFSNCISILLFG